MKKIACLIGFLGLGLMLWSNLTIAMEEEKTKTELIKFNDEEKFLLGWVLTCQLDSDHPFSVTSVVRKTDEGFTTQGDILNLSEKDLEDIGNDNYVYTPFYTLAKTRLSGDQYKEIGAIILGTKDPDDAKKLHFASVRKIVQNAKK